MSHTPRHHAAGNIGVLDPLYGRVEFGEHASALIRTPVLQRLRHVQLSNIDSMDLPGISGISRLEHVIGAASLTSRLGFAERLSPEEALALQASVLLHDSAITPFGHLIEEAYHYTGTGFAHELKWSQLAEESEPSELGGTDLQIYCGRRAGIRDWANGAFGSAARARLTEILNSFDGKGRFGPLVASDLDLDNIDNVTRIAYHMGLEVDRKLPVALCMSITECDESDGIVFADEGPELVRRWLTLREAVYTQLMLSPHDFAGKLMVIAATVEALRSNVLVSRDWTLSDWELLNKLTSNDSPAIREPVRRWLLGDCWDLSDLSWFRGQVPPYKKVFAFNDEVSAALKRTCFAYRIKDKRTREVVVRVGSRPATRMGAHSDRWLLGVGSAKRQAFTRADNQRIVRMAEQFFDAEFDAPAKSRADTELNLFS